MYFGRLFARLEAWVGIDTKDDHNLLFVDFDAFDQGADDFTLGLEIDRFQSLVDSRSKFFETIDHQKQLELPCLMLFNPFDLVIMDLTIPGRMGGEEAVQEILNIDPIAKVIVSSGYSNDPIMANFKDYGFCSAIVKPYQLQKLSKVINQLIL